MTIDKATSILFILVMNCCFAPSISWAQASKTSEAQDARNLIIKGNRAWRQGSFDRAQRHYDRAYELDPTTTLLYRRAQTLEARGRLNEAILLYTLYLEQEPDAPYAKEIRAHVDELITKAPPVPKTNRLWPLKLTLKPPVARVTLNGKLQAYSPTFYSFRLTPGPHVLSIQSPGYLTRRITLEAGEEMPSERLVVLEKAPQQDEPTLKENPPEKKKSSPLDESILTKVELGPPTWAKVLGWSLVPPGTLMTGLSLVALSTEPELDALMTSFLLLGPAMLTTSSVLLFVYDWPARTGRPLTSQGQSAAQPARVIGPGVFFKF